MFVPKGVMQRFAVPRQGDHHPGGRDCTWHKHQSRGREKREEGQESFCAVEIVLGEGGEYIDAQTQE